MNAASDQKRGAAPSLQLAWLPDETLFSLCSRQHLVLGNLDPATTSNAMLGLSEKFIKHDIPCGLAAFQKTSFQYLGSPESILFDHTIFPLFVPFQTKSKIENAIETVKGDRIDSLKYRLGMISSGFGAEHPLKACPGCMHEDAHTYGVAYWHLSHQYPGVLICPKHQAWLRASTQSRRWSGRFAWSLPTDDILIEQALLDESWSRSACLSISEKVLDLASIGRRGCLELGAVAATYRAALLQGGRSTSLLDHTEPLRHFYLFESLPADERSADSFVSQLIQPPRRSIHPLKHLVLIDWLFDDLTSFLNAYKGELARAPLQVVSPPTRAPDERVPAPIGAVSARSHPRPKRLKGRLKEELLSKLADGAAKRELCEEFQITISTINKLLRAYPATYAQALETKHHRELDEHRHQWQNMHGLYPRLGVKALRNKTPSLYAWLYRNDKTWLMTEKQSFEKPVPADRHIVDWDARDSRLLGMLQAACESITRLQHGPVTMAKLYAVVPMLSTCLENRSRYPESRAYLSLVTAQF